jgi:hypothetical protein
MWEIFKNLEFDHLETQRLNQDPIENICCAIHLCCISNDNPTVGEFVVALKTTLLIPLLLGVHITLTMKKKILVFWTTYIPYPGDLNLLHLTLSQVTLEEPLKMLIEVLVLLSKYN